MSHTSLVRSVIKLLKSRFYIATNFLVFDITNNYSQCERSYRLIVALLWCRVLNFFYVCGQNRDD